MAAWHTRAASYNTFIKHVITPLEQARQRPLTILDIGAGNGWLSYRLSTRGHAVAAVDLLTNRFDGLGARSFYDRPFPAIQAEFDHLPLLDGAADVVVYNASFHYSTNYEQTLSEARRVLQNNGIATIIDSPIYQSGDSGRQMVLERKAQFSKDFSRAGDALSSENYLTYARLDQLAHSEGLTWRFVWPVPAWRRRIRQWRSRWSGRREPAQFPVLLAQWSFNNR
jgi:ubiquinone/menaquinone biosynthesis C-methylase UbiE